MRVLKSNFRSVVKPPKKLGADPVDCPSMKMPDVGILVVSCDRYADLWEPFFHCFFKYWKDCPYPVYLGTNTLTYADKRVQSLPIGTDISYCDNLRLMLRMVKQDWVIFWVEDRILADRIETTRVEELVSEAKSKNAAYLKLIPQHALAYLVPGRNCGEVPRGSHYRVSMTIALWQKQCLNSLLRPGETAWQLEKLGSRRSDEMPAPFLSLAPKYRTKPVLPHVHIIVKGRLIRSARSFLAKEGFAGSLTKRQLESMRSSLYIKVYHILLAPLWAVQYMLLSKIKGKW